MSLIRLTTNRLGRKTKVGINTLFSPEKILFQNEEFLEIPCVARYYTIL